MYCETAALLLWDMKKSTLMIDKAADSTPEELPLGTRLSIENTRLAIERTVMAWVRTGTSMITFGFTIYKFFQMELMKTGC